MISLSFIEKPHNKILFVGYLIILFGCIQVDSN